MTVWVPAYSEAPISDHDRRLIVEVAWASRILAMVGYEDLTLGHVSARGSDDSTIYIKRKGVALGEVTPEDILAVDLGTDTSNGGQGMHLETVLHTEVYKRRPDVRSVVHGHPPYATAFGATDAEFAYLTHDSVLFIDRVSTYDGVPDLIVDEEQGSSGCGGARSEHSAAVAQSRCAGGRARRAVGSAGQCAARARDPTSGHRILDRPPSPHPRSTPARHPRGQVPVRLRRGVLGRLDSHLAPRRPSVRHARGAIAWTSR